MLPHAPSYVMVAALLLASLQTQVAAVVHSIDPDGGVRVREGGSISLHCYGDRSDSLYWFDGSGQRITEEGSFDLHLQQLPVDDQTFTVHTLEINPVTQSHNGSYCCSIQSSAGAGCSSGMVAELIVLIASSPAVASSKQRFEANTDAFVRCSTQPGFPLPTIVWYSHKAGRTLDFRSSTGDRIADGRLKFEANYSGLMIRDFQPSDVSNYTCEYQEPYTASTSRVNIEVLLATSE